MNVVVAVFADFERAFLGGPTRLLDVVAGRTVIDRTLSRVAAIERVAKRVLVTAPTQADAGRRALARAGVEGDVSLAAIDEATRFRGELLRAGRVWALDAWRGGVLGGTWFDEFVEPAVVASVVETFSADAVLCIAGCSPLLDASLAEAQIAFLRDNAEADMVFTQASPGIAGLLLSREKLAELLKMQIPVGIDFAYRPEAARVDPLHRHSCLLIDDVAIHHQARFTADTHASQRRVSQAIALLGDAPSYRDLAAWTRDADGLASAALPKEFEIELTTRDPLSGTSVRPRAEAPIDLSSEDEAVLVERLGELAAFDDRLVVFGGDGDPLAHPRLPQLLNAARDAGVCGLAVRTPLVDLPESAEAALFGASVDVLEVLLDAHSRETYARVHGRDAFEQVRANIERIETLRRRTNRPRPIVVCSMIRCAATLPELEAFYDYWIPKTGWAVIHGHSTFDGRVAADSLQRLMAPLREPCRRLWSRMVLRADGSASACDQSRCAGLVVGDWRTSSLGEIWSGLSLNQLRVAHGLNQAPEVCLKCSEWGRP